MFGAASQAFDVRKEDSKTRARYGERLGEQMLAARRLCEAGCGFVTISYGGWDMKQTALGLHNFHDTYLYLPHGTYEYIDNTTGNGPPPYGASQDRRCWAHDLYPFIEQRPLFDKFQAWMDNPANSALGFPDLQTLVKSFVCPSDGLSPKYKTYWGGINTPDQGYSANQIALATSTYFTGPASPGSYLNSVDLNGLFFAASKVRFGMAGNEPLLE